MTNGQLIEHLMKLPREANVVMAQYTDAMDRRRVLATEIKLETCRRERGLNPLLYVQGARHGIQRYEVIVLQ